MIPKDAPKQDWSMYYDCTYMTHAEYGPCHISVSQTDSGTKYLVARRVHQSGKLGASERVKANKLQILWPRPGAYNFARQETAGFIGRMPQRHMKRSAYRDHYYIQWAPTGIPGDYLMNQIVLNAKYFTLEQFLGGLEKKVPQQCGALSNKVILYRPGQTDSKISVIYMGEELGYLNKVENLVPHMANDSRLSRIYRHLTTVGIS